ncbi:MAG: hypothetical protein HZY78_04865 [Burkholderiaceae bacterium]|nr:MAG: hypothetical protein HZY78_04865 [Burkholderiaceae bacterium]
MSNKTLTPSSRALRGLTATALVCAALAGCGGGDGAETADTYFPPSVRVVGQVVGKDGVLLASGTVQAYDALGPPAPRAAFRRPAATASTSPPAPRRPCCSRATVQAQRNRSPSCRWATLARAAAGRRGSTSRP